MKFFLQILFLLLTCFINLANSTKIFAKVVLPSYEVTFSKTENVKEENIVKIGEQNFARGNIEENLFSQNRTSRVSYALLGASRAGVREVVNGVGSAFKSIDELLTQFNSIIGNKGLKHLFRGEINSSGVASGVHHISAVRAGTAKIIPNTIDDLGNGFYRASVQVSDGAGGWVTKTEKSTFFLMLEMK